ncbi:ATP-binding cassette domain-containing protein [Bifidobacterium amazonense]|uniref:ATP-binding cassette domain-containing protein n=1 Tax=Bifidobacterium amazonense TaxID=2809027 RepID=A0ABS9VTH0_9BIFI|nr:ATP-binding cassette domain-containing protein [Bifidobacterium amazonense]MCH9275386.1 ATP-binding cassette domain-containing protein [Bifidobacterium amazonense]
MFDKRLFSLADGIGRLVAGKVALMWLGLLANVAFVATLVTMLSDLLRPFVPGAVSGMTSDAASGSAQGSVSAATTAIDAIDAMLPTIGGTAAGRLPWYLLALALIAAVRYATTRGATRLGFEAAERVKLSLREKLYRKMLALGPSYGSRVKTADVVQSAGEGVEQIQSFFELFLPQLFYAVLAPLTLFVVLLPVNLPGAVTLLVCAPLIVVIVGLVAMRAARVFKKYWGKYTDMGAAFLDNLQGLETLKIFDADERAARDMDRKAEEFRVMTMNVLQIQLRSLTAMDTVAYGGAAAGIGVAVWQFAAGSLGLPGAIMIVLLSADFFIPLRQLGSFFHVAMNGMTSTKRIFALLDAPEPQHGTETLPADSGAPVVTFERVGFTYEDADVVADDGKPATPAGAENAGAGYIDGVGKAGDVASGTSTVPSGTTDVTSARPALADATFMANPGQVTAIVGVSGSGKSTAAALLSGTLTGYTGSIALFDFAGRHEIRDLTDESLMRAVTVVGARSHLFAGTLRDDLAMAMTAGPDESAMWDALRRARIDDFVRSHGGLDMTIEPDAANLSGGQRQRVAIARALLHDSPVIVFDEATSSVDADSESLILASIRELADAGKTVIMITHRMANAADADAIVVLDHGHVVESGSHVRLLAANGTYARLFRTQQAVEQVGRRDGADVSEDAADAADPVAKTTASAAESDRHAATHTTKRARKPRSKAARTATAVSDTAGDSATGDRTPSGPDDETRSAKSVSSAKQPNRGTRLIPRLLHEAAPLSRFMILACVCGTLGHLAATFLPVFGTMALFAAAGHPVWGMGVAPSVVAMAVCAVVRGLMRYAEQFMNHNVAFRLLALFRAKAFAALRRLAPAKLDGKGKGDLIALITTDVEMLEIFFAHTISPVVIALSTSVIYTLALLALDPWSALLLVAAHLTVGVLLPWLFARGVHGIGDGLRKAASALDNQVLDGMRGIGEIIRFGAGERRVTDIVERTRDLWARRAKLSRINGHYAGVGGVLVLVFTAVAALLAVAGAAGIVGVSGSTGTAGVLMGAPKLVVAVVLIASSFGPTLALAALPANLTNTFAAARRLFSLMDEAPAVTETGIDRPAYDGMALDHVTFAYPAVMTGGDDDGERLRTTSEAGPTSVSAGSPTADGHAVVTPSATASATVLDDVSLDVPRTGILGIQGPSGRGKSTMLKLLMRYWDPQSGRVTLSGEPLPRVDAHHRRRVQTMMSQETALFDGTIRDNLLIALPEAGAMDAAAPVATPETDAGERRASAVGGASAADAPTAGMPSVDDLLREACRKASVLDLIDSLPAGLDTPVGELGDRLSEGERQRIGLARIFLRQADLVLFDEPTSRLDALNEAVILQSINALAGERDAAIVLVSHRESAMRIADRIVAA